MSAARPTLAPSPTSLRSLVDALLDDAGIVTGLRLAEQLQLSACWSSGAEDTVRPLIELLDQRDDELAAIAAVHALSATPGSLALGRLVDRLDDDRWFVTEHAAWALSARPAHRPAMGRLAAMLLTGDFRAMLAQRTLIGWARADPVGALAALAAHVGWAGGATSLGAIEAIGTISGRPATTLLEAVAHRDCGPAQLAAIGALGWRAGDPEVLARLARRDDAAGEAALLAMLDRQLPDRPVSAADRRVRVAQVVFHADVEGGGASDGAGDNGGLAMLVRQLAQSLDERGDVAQVTTIARGQRDDAIADVTVRHDERQRFGPVPLDTDQPVERRAGWPHRITVERGVRRILLAGVRPDVVHLRMADVGTLAAERVARELDIPVVFTCAPDPHVTLDQLDDAGGLARRNFGGDDAMEHWWFRARMVERLTGHADQVVVFPRPRGRRPLPTMLGDRVTQALDRAVVVPEGIDPRPLARALTVVERAATTSTCPPALAPLAEAIAALPVPRWGLPLVVSVGRLHPTKGMGRLAQAWMDDLDGRSSTNLLIVGGDLQRPSADELDVLDELEGILGGAEARRAQGVLLLGHQPHETVAHVLAATAVGLPGLVGPGGVYVAAAAKEEFGLAIVEALGVGLTVVAPNAGGPPTYVTHGDTGILTDTRSPARLRRAIGDARQLVDRPGRADRAKALVREHLTIDAMAGALLGAYESARVTVA